jgi:DNA repair protein RadC
MHQTIQWIRSPIHIQLERAIMTQQYSRVPIYSLKLIRERSVKYPLPTVGNEVQAAVVLRAFLHDKDCEHLAILMLDARNNFLGVHDVATGGMTGLRAGVRDIFKAAIVGRANSIVMGHNHPSGDVTPSEEDIAFTHAVNEASVIMQIPLMDHVIVSSGYESRSFSFLDHGLLRH